MQKRKKIIARWAVLFVLASASALAAHHSLARFDTDTPIRLKGAVVAFERVNPHSIIFLDQKTQDGVIQRWAVEGASATQLARRPLEKDFLKAGDVIEVCGFALKEGVPSQRTLSEPISSNLTSISGRVLSGHVLTMPDGKRLFWADYGVLDKCLGPGETRESLIR